LLEAERETVQRLLGRLSRYGDRVIVELGDEVRQFLQVDSSMIRLRLGAGAG